MDYKAPCQLFKSGSVATRFGGNKGLVLFDDPTDFIECCGSRLCSSNITAGAYCFG